MLRPAATALLLLIAAGCGGGPDRTSATPGPCAATAIRTSTAGERIAAPGPGVLTVLDFQGDATAGRVLPMTWLIDERRAGPELRLLAMRLENTADIVAAGPFPSAAASSSNVRFESTLALPRAGCWDITASSGTARAELILKLD